MGSLSNQTPCYPPMVPSYSAFAIPKRLEVKGERSGGVAREPMTVGRNARIRDVNRLVQIPRVRKTTL